MKTRNNTYKVKLVLNLFKKVTIQYCDFKKKMKKIFHTVI